MIIDNGKILFQTVQNGGISNTTGLPLLPTTQWGAAIACQYQAKSVNLKATDTADNAYVAQSYEVLVDIRVEIVSERVRLKDSANNTIGDFRVVSVEKLPAVGLAKLTL